MDPRSCSWPVDCRPATAAVAGLSTVGLLQQLSCSWPVDCRPATATAHSPATRPIAPSCWLRASARTSCACAPRRCRSARSSPGGRAARTQTRRGPDGACAH
eukprot:366379-Chlamydomonas_euryale.AAC.10